MYNKVLLIGNLTRDPELRYTPSGIPVARFAIAVNRVRRKNAAGDGNQEVDFINIVAWRRLAEICGEYLKKGRPVAVEGRLQIRNYKARTGEMATMTEVIADNMQMLGRSPVSGRQSPVDNGQETGDRRQETEEETDGEIPF